MGTTFEDWKSVESKCLRGVLFHSCVHMHNISLSILTMILRDYSIPLHDSPLVKHYYSQTYSPICCRLCIRAGEMFLYMYTAIELAVVFYQTKIVNMQETTNQQTLMI